DLAGDPRKHVRLEPGRDQAIAMNKEDVGRRSLGEISLAIEHQSVVGTVLLRCPSREETVDVSTANFDLAGNRAARNPFDCGYLTPDGVFEVAVRIGPHGEDAHVDRAPFRPGDPELGTAAKRDRPDVLGALRLLLQEFDYSLVKFLDRPRKDQPHAGGALAKSDQMILGAVKIVMVVVPVRHEAVEHARSKMERDACDRRRTLLAIQDLAVVPAMRACQGHR